MIIERWRHFYNHQRPHSALDYRTPAQARQAGPELVNIDVRLNAWVVTKSNRRSAQVPRMLRI